MGLITKELPESNGHAPLEITHSAPPQRQVSEKDRSIALQVGLKIAGPAMTGYSSSPEQWLELTVKMGRALQEEIIR